MKYTSRELFETLKDIFDKQDSDRLVTILDSSKQEFDYRYEGIEWIVERRSNCNPIYGFLTITCVMKMNHFGRQYHVIEFTLAKARIDLLESEEEIGWDIDDMTIQDVLLDLIDDNDLSC